MLENVKNRCYKDGCAFAQALDLVGERWALLVMRELMFGAKRFSDLKESLPGIASNILTRRLADLEGAGIVQKVPLPRPARGQAYALTEWGKDFREVIRVMGAWAARSPHLAFGWPLSPAAAMLSLSSMFDAEKAADATLGLELRLSGEVFAIRVDNGRLTVEPEPLPGADCIVTGDQNDLLPVLYAGKPIEAAIADQSLTAEGNPKAVTAFSTMLRKPQPAPLDL